MSFDLLIPTRGPRADTDEVRLRLHRDGAHKTLTLTVNIGGGLVARLGWARGQAVHLGIGGIATPDKGRLRVVPAADGHFRLSSPGAAKALRVVTRTLHPSLVLDECPATAAVIVQADAGGLVVRIPTSFLRTAAVSGIMDDEHRRRA